MDFADFRLPWGKRHALIVVLGYSRRMWLRFYERQTMPVVMRGLERSFAYFGGVPSELLFDQMTAVITGNERDQGGRLIENPELATEMSGPRVQAVLQSCGGRYLCLLLNPDFPHWRIAKYRLATDR